MQVRFKGNKIKADGEFISNQCDHPTPLLTLVQQDYNKSWMLCLEITFYCCLVTFEKRDKTKVVNFMLYLIDHINKSVWCLLNRVHEKNPLAGRPICNVILGYFFMLVFCSSFDFGGRIDYFKVWRLGSKDPDILKSGIISQQLFLRL